MAARSGGSASRSRTAAAIAAGVFSARDQPGRAGLHHLRVAPDRACDDRRAAGHRLEQDVGPAFPAGGEHQKVGGGVDRRQLRMRPRTEEANPRRKAEATRERLQPRPLRSLAHDQQVAIRAAGAAPRSRGGDPCARSAARPRARSDGARPRAARAAARSAAGWNSAVSTPLRSTVTCSGGAPSATIASFSAALTATAASAAVSARRISRRGMPKRGNRLMSEPRAVTTTGRPKRRPSRTAATPSGKK